MAKQLVERTYDDAIAWLRDRGFDLLEAPGTAHRSFLKKYGCSAAIEKSGDGSARVFAYPGVLIGSEISKLVDKGFQKFFKTTKTEAAATADQLKALHQFTEELTEALGKVSLYNESLGTVSSEYVYDRVNGRDARERRQRPWEKKRSKPSP